MDKVGFVIVTFGVMDAIGSFALSILIKIIGRVPLFITASVINLTVIAFLFFWVPNSNEAYFFFITAALWGTSDAIWQTQINGK